MGVSFYMYITPKDFLTVFLTCRAIANVPVLCSNVFNGSTVCNIPKHRYLTQNRSRIMSVCSDAFEDTKPQEEQPTALIFSCLL